MARNLEQITEKNTNSGKAPYTVKQTPPASHKMLLTVKDVAWLLSISDKTVESWAEQFPDFPRFLRYGGRRLMRYDELENWVQIHTSA